MYKRNLITAMWAIFWEQGRPLSAEVVAELIRLDKCVDEPLPATDEIHEEARKNNVLNADGLIEFPKQSGLHHWLEKLKSDHLKPLALSLPIAHDLGVDAGFMYAGLLSTVRSLLPYSPLPLGEDIRTYLRPGMDRRTIATLLDQVGGKSGVARLAERLRVSDWPERFYRDFGRLVRIQVSLHSRTELPGGETPGVGHEYFVLASSSTKTEDGSVLMKREDPFASLADTIRTFPYDEWFHQRSSSNHLFFPDARMAVFIFDGSVGRVATRDMEPLEVAGYCRDEDDRDGVRLLLASRGITHKLFIGDMEQGLPQSSLANIAFVACPNDGTKALFHAKEFHRNATAEGSAHRRLFLVCPSSCLDANDEWASMRQELIKQDWVDCAIQLQSWDNPDALAMLILDNRKPDDAKGSAFFVNAVNDLEITWRTPVPPELKEGLVRMALRTKLEQIAREREVVGGRSTRLLNSVVQSIGHTSLNPRPALLHPFAAISKQYPWEELGLFKPFRELVDPDRLADDGPDAIVKALLPEVTNPEYIRHELEQPYVAEQMELLHKYWNSRSLLNCYIRVPSLKEQQKVVSDRNSSWGLLPLQGVSGITKDWIANLVDNIQLRKDNPEGCVQNLQFIIREVQRMERTHALAEAKEAFKVYAHDLGNMTGRVRDSLALSEINEGLDEYWDATKQLLEDFEKVFKDEQTRMEPVDLHEVIELVASRFAFGGDVRILNRVTNVLVWADRQQLDRCLTNMIENAMRHGKIEGRPLTVALEDLRDQEPGYVYLLVANDGHPLSMPLSELMKWRKRSLSSKGSGMGLYMVRKWIKGMGGAVGEGIDGYSAGQVFLNDIHPPMEVCIPIRLRAANQ